MIKDQTGRRKAPVLQKSASFLIPVMFFISVQGIDLFHFFICKLKIKEIQIFPDMFRITGTWDYHYSLLQIPSQNNLS